MFNNMKKLIKKTVSKVKAPKEILCEACKGTGRDTPNTTCPKCNGTGK